MNEKVSKASVHYREGTSARHCGNCSMYSERTCSRVAGLIQPDDACDIWQAKKAAKSTRQIHLVRHGATERNSDNVSLDRIRGHQDWPLTAAGRNEARKLASIMEKNKPDAIVTSDLVRAKDTAKIISRETGIPIVEISKAFRPWDVGKYTGSLSIKAVPVLARYALNTPNKPVPGGECFNDFKSRFFSGLRKALRDHPGAIAIVTHHRNERLLHAWKRAGFPISGEIHGDEFARKGSATANAELLMIPMDRLNHAS